MNAKYCDHCGAQFIDHEDIKNELEVHMSEFEIFNCYEKTKESVQLCEKCEKELYEFIERGKTKVVNEFNNKKLCQE
jgi:hypothetical protein